MAVRRSLLIATGSLALGLAMLCGVSLLRLGTAGAGSGASCHGHPATIVGTGGSDQLRGTPHGDVIQAKAGRDLVWGNKGEDVICGGAHNDDLRGGRGDDYLNGGPDEKRGSDYLTGGPGIDICRNGVRFGSCEKR